MAAASICASLRVRRYLYWDVAVRITPDSARFEQTFSDDEGKTWETNWVMTF
jgi:hypothetical protein